MIRTEAAVIELGELLGEGLSSRVFSGLRKDSRGFSQQDVVLKILKTETDVAFFKREFDALSKLRSPYCVRILGWENLPEGPALLLERVDGVTLWDYAAGLALTSEEVDEITAQIQAGLQAVHESGLHHGDLSPRNVMVDRAGDIRLIDFAMVTGKSDVITGTPPYLAPEVWQGAPSGPRADLYALGLLRADLLDGFQFQSSARDACWERALRYANTCSLTQLEPTQRTFQPLVSVPRVRRQLAQRVHFLLERRRRVVSTQVLECSETSRSPSRAPSSSPTRRRSLALSERSWRRTSAAAVLCLCVWAAPTLLGSTVSARVSDPGFGVGAKIQIRTLRWTEFALNGRSLGYAPTSVANLAPGRYSLVWRDSRGSGEIVLNVRAASSILITDREIDATRD
ncbi:MAG: protein kinase [Bdellovibrionaceae bacterium]|nr:protein kinase [Pseudobdellovibrionaceae bacterium]